MQVSKGAVTIGVACLLHAAVAAKILALLPVPSRSHSILMERLLTHLHTRGHHITYITPFQPSATLQNVTIIHLPDLISVMVNGVVTKPSSNLLMTLKDRSAWEHQRTLPPLGYALCEYILSQQSVQALLSHHFDLILGEIFLDESLLAGFSSTFNAPIVAVSPLQPGVWAAYMTGTPSLTSYIPDPFLDVGSKMTFWERFKNTIFVKMIEMHYVWFALPQQDAIMRKYLGHHIPPIQEILKNTSLVLVNHHHSIGFARPYGPNMIEVAGFHVEDPKPLPQELQSYMNNSKAGVIYFSLGTNALSSHMPSKTIDAFIKAFARLKVNVLWKFETDLPNLPKNVKIMKWLPQTDILGHPNVLLFVSHGGLLSTIEAVEKGIPLVGIPLFADQYVNMKHIEDAGLGRTVVFDDITEELLYTVLTDVLNNPDYKNVALAKSKLLKDQPMPAIERAVWWVEYVLRHKGASNLRSAAQDLNYLQLHLLDVYSGMVAMVVVAIVTLTKWTTLVRYGLGRMPTNIVKKNS